MDSVVDVLFCSYKNEDDVTDLHCINASLQLSDVMNTSQDVSVDE